MTIDALINQLEKDLIKAREGAKIEEKTVSIYAHGFRDGEAFAYEKIIAMLKEMKYE
jgi:hypothetical protein